MMGAIGCRVRFQRAGWDCVLQQITAPAADVAAHFRLGQRRQAVKGANMVDASRYCRVTVPQCAVEIEQNGPVGFPRSALRLVHGTSPSLSRSWFVLVECRGNAIRGSLMSNSNLPNLPPVTAEQRRVAVGKFERANQVIATWNFDYGIHLLMDCCKIDPANLVYRQKLRATEKVKYRNNLRGSFFA